MTKNSPQNFSISTQNSDIIEILSKIPNKSEFICKAIREKFRRDNCGIAGTIDDEKLEEMIKDTIFKLFKKDMFIVSGDIKAISTVSCETQPMLNTELEESKPEKTPEIIEEEKESSDDKEKNERIKNIFMGW